MSLPFYASPNFSPTQMKKELCIIHFTLGQFSGARTHLSSPHTGVSIHFLIGRTPEEGSIQMVHTNDMAWHAGVFGKDNWGDPNPSERFKKVAKKHPSGAYVNPNLYSVGIEFCAGYDVDRDGFVEPEENNLTAWQYEEGVRVMQNHLGFTLDSDHLITHRDIASYKPDLENVLDEFKFRLFGKNYDGQVTTPQPKTVPSHRILGTEKKNKVYTLKNGSKANVFTNTKNTDFLIYQLNQ